MADVVRVESLLVRAGLPVLGPAMGAESYLELMQHDKKVKDGKMRFVLLERIGKALVSDAASQAEISQAIVARSAHA